MSMADRDEATKAVIDGLKKLYHTKLKPLEQAYLFDFFHSPLLTDSEFDSKPQVLMIGQYSTGKTSFIRYLLGRDFPGQRIGPEPTTDRFVAVMDGADERVIPGNALTVSPNLPYRGLDRFGVAFLNKFEGSQLPSPVLRNITIVDTPGVLSGEKQRVARGYDFVQVNTWFAERADLILLLFDAHKLDISDEFRAVIEKLRGQDDKIRCILNKADAVDRQKLMRVYGALMWSMGKIIKTPEVLRVYVGSFWDEPLMYDDNAALFDMEERDLMNDLRDLPRNSAVRKINELVKRCRLAKVHAYIIGHLRAQMPGMVGKEKAQRKLMQDMGSVFRAVMKQYNLAPGDFPDLETFRSKCEELSFAKFPKLKPKMLQDLDEVLSQDIPRLMEMLPTSDVRTRAEREVASLLHAPGPLQFGGGGGGGQGSPPPPLAHATSLSALSAARTSVPQWQSSKASSESQGMGVPNPFGGSVAEEPLPWALEEEAHYNVDKFNSLGPQGGLLAATAARGPLMETGLSTDMLRVIWDLSDMDKDGALDLAEYTVAMHLCAAAKAGDPVPSALPAELVPPDKRHLVM
eukprot:TRINITY_DN4107_c0_g1_i1.p1 TRINITY_DN4107_c0_g1~~TRINITY_DN4107_c0_g1_i1.p1  ORF type:complete len:617 (+),score=239.25 TRINITY_DN4107_c0_g1_i1:132-1853(+)